MAGLVYDEQSLVHQQMYKYDTYLHSRINKYTGDGRTLVTYYNINDACTSTSMGFESHYKILGKDSPLRFDKIDNMVLVGLTSLNPEDKQAGSTQVRDYGLSGDAFVIPGTIMPKENDMFIIDHLNMNHLFRVTQVTQDGLNTDGSYKIAYTLFTSNPEEIKWLDCQITKTFKMDLQTIGGEDLTPIIGEEDYVLRSRLISMIDDMVENYKAQFYDKIHNCFILHLNSQSLFDLCGNMFMARTSIMIQDNSNGNVVLNPNKVRADDIDMLYQKSPYKWLERDAPIRYLETFKYHVTNSYNYPDSSFAKYGNSIDIIIPNDPWCDSEYCDQYFPDEIYRIFDTNIDHRCCCPCDCHCCKCRKECKRNEHIKSYDYVSLIHRYIHGDLKSIHDLSLYIGDQLFDNSMSKEIYLWTPIVVYIIKQILKHK